VPPDDVPRIQTREEGVGVHFGHQISCRTGHMSDLHRPMQK
jgi:hypothetical protein